MRKLLDPIIDTNGIKLPPIALPSFSPPTPSLSPTSPDSLTDADEIVERRPVPFALDFAVDLFTFTLISSLVLLSVLSFSLILHLRLRSRRLQSLRHFNSLSTTRLILVAFAFFWALNEVLRLPLFGSKYPYHFLPSLTLKQQANLCKAHVISSFGLFQPGFLVTLLFLINTSIQKATPRCVWALASVCVVCCPILLLQVFFVFLSPLEAKLPRFMHESSILSSDIHGNITVLCTYPFFSCIIFGAFATAYSLAFLVTCWRVASIVINKSIRTRINMLSFTVMVALPVQILCFGISPLWFPQDPAHGFVALLMFLAVVCCVAVGQVILVIWPIADALAAGLDRCQSQHGGRSTGIEISNNQQ